MTSKQDIRILLRQNKPAGFSDEEEFAFVSCLTCMPEIIRSHTLLLYSALPDEVPTQLLIKNLLMDRKTILLPRVVDETTMELRHYTGIDDLQKGAYGIMEPTGELFTDYDQIEVAIVPGMAFDKEGHRLGRGKGYYDRFLPLLKNAYKIGVCHPSRLLDHVPTDEHDVRMDYVWGGN